MGQSIGVLTVHGMGSVAPVAPESVAVPSYSAPLADGVRDVLGLDLFNEHVAWREAFYGDLFDTNQEAYLARIESLVDVDWFRRFVVQNLGDPASYRRESPSARNQVYDAVHTRVDVALIELRRHLNPGAPIVVLAHSLGGHVVSNYLWDVQRRQGMQQPADIAALVTFGCNIPVFLFAYAFDDVRAINYPGAGLDEKYRLKCWWHNFYDKDDPLGFPLAQIGKGYQQLAAEGALEDRRINVGGLFTSWNPLSHTAYWDDWDLVEPVARLIDRLVEP